MNFISISRKLKYCTKEIIKVTNIMAIAFIMIVAIMLIKYKPVYKVSISETEVGLVDSKEQIEQWINEKVNKSDTKNVAFISLEEAPNFEMAFVDKQIQTDNEQVIAAVEDKIKTTYTMYAITLNGNEMTYVETIQQAEQAVNTLKEDKQEQLDLGIRQIYTEEQKEVETVEVAIEKIEQNQEAEIVPEEKQTPAKPITQINGIQIATKPISGTITSRFGVNSRVRSSSHTGLDIAAKSGTPICAVAEGDVVYAGRKGSYGNIIKIAHGNGVETWYAHCSKLYASEGEHVVAGDKIAAVGSTGNSTGPHLHLEVRINNEPVNPQKYLYK